MIITKEDINEFEKHYRTHLINCLPGFKPANLVGTQSASGINNLAIISSVVHLGSSPALLGLIMRPKRRTGGTLDNILSTGFYTLNHVNQDIVDKAHQTSARYPAEASEFDQTGLAATYLKDFTAPFVAESKIKIAMSFAEHIPLSINDTHLIIGRVEFVALEEAFVGQDGFIDLVKAGTTPVTGLDSYHKASQLARFSYAKPDKDLELL